MFAMFAPACCTISHLCNQERAVSSQALSCEYDMSERGHGRGIGKGERGKEVKGRRGEQGKGRRGTRGSREGGKGHRQAAGCVEMKQ